MRLLATTFVLIFASAPHGSFAKDKPLVALAKSGPWVMNYDTDSCHLVGAFGSGKQQTDLSLTRYQPGDIFELLLAGKTVATQVVQQNVEIQFGANLPVQQIGATSGTLGDNRTPMIMLSGRFDGAEYKGFDHPLAPVSPAQEKAITEITFRQPGSKFYRLETGSLGPPMAAMRACTENLIKSWGYDPAVQSSLRRPATPTSDPTTWAHSSDFPNVAAFFGHSGIVQFRLDIDRTGAITGCHILHRTDPDEFAKLTCNLLSRRGKFLPALDKNSQPVMSFYVNSVRWLAWQG